MIQRKHRFHGHSSLNFVYQHGKTLRGQHTSLKFVENPKRSAYRLAVVVSRKVHKSAVVRNRIRRRIYEIVRLHEGQMQVSYDMVLTVFSDVVAELPHDKLQEQLMAQLKESKLIQL